MGARKYSSLGKTSLSRKLPKPQQKQLDEARKAFDVAAYADAAGLCQVILKSVPNQPEAAELLVKCLAQTGQLTQAIQFARQLVQVHSDYGAGHSVLAQLLDQSGAKDEALRHYAVAIEHGIDEASVCIRCGHIAMELGQSALAYKAYQKALILNPDDNGVWYHLWQAAKAAETIFVDDDFIEVLAAGLAQHTGNSELQAAIAKTYLIDGIESNTLLEDVYKEGAPNSKLLEQSSVQKKLQNAVMLSYMRYQKATDWKLELFLTYIRRIILHQYSADLLDKGTLKRILPFVSALAHLCFRNEYVFHETASEADQVNALQKKVQQMEWMELEKREGQCALFLLMSYRDVSRCDGLGVLEELHKGTTNTEVKALLRKQLEEPRIEKEIGESIAIKKGGEDQVSDAVQSMYEENPYPRWEILPQNPKRSLQAELASILPSERGNIDIPEKPAMLIAGSGTGKQVLQTYNRFAPSRMLAIDLSRASLSYAIRKAQEHSANQIEFRQQNILDLDDADGTFDIVESVGVLHHMEDPMKGWRAITERLKPTGIMKVALYSETARKAVVEGRALIANEGFETSLEGIRACRAHIIQRHKEERFSALFRMVDFYSTSECRDLLFHVQEHRYTIPQIRASIDALNLRFLGFEHVAPHVMEHYKERFPDDPDGLVLENWEQMEVEDPSLFLGMYHFWMSKK